MTAANNDSNDNSKNNNLRITSDELKKKIDKGGGILYSTYEINTNMMIGICYYNLNKQNLFMDCKLFMNI
jgi:hypothetical protein